MSLTFARQLKLNIRPLEKGEYSSVVSANSTRIQVMGKADVSINMDGYIVPYTFLVLEHLVHSVMFGIDILKHLQAQIDLQHDQVSFGDGLITLPITKSHGSSVTLRSVKAMVIPPRSEVVIPVCHVGHFLFDTAFVEPAPEMIKRQILGARLIVSPQNKRTVCRLLNPTLAPKRIR